MAAIFFMASFINNYEETFFLAKDFEDKGFFYKVLGEFRKVLSDYAFIRADEYYHSGLTIQNRLNEKEDLFHESEEAHGESAKKMDYAKNPFPKGNILAFISEEVALSEHMHLHGGEEKELLPWLYYSVKLDPNNINAYVIGSDWLNTRLNKTNEAIDFLKLGLTENPDSWQIYEELGRISFFKEKNFNMSLSYFQKALALQNQDNADIFERGEVLSFVAASYEKLGDKEKATQYYKEKCELFPDNPAVQKKVEMLEAETEL